MGMAEVPVVSDLLYLIRSFPSRDKNAEQVLAALLFPLCLDVSGHKLEAEEIDLRNKMLLALARKLDSTRRLKPRFKEPFQDELKDPHYSSRVSCTDEFR